MFKTMISAVALSAFLAAPVAAGTESVADSEQVASADIGEAQGFVADLAGQAINIMDSTPPSTEVGGQKLRTLLSDGMSFQTMGQRVVGDSWGSISASEQEEFTGLFRAYMLNYFVDMLEDSGPDGFEMVTARRLDDRDVLVRTSAFRSGFALADVDWIVRRVDGHYQVVDVVLGEVSLVRTYGSEFGSLINFRGIDALMAALRTKVQAH